jgi:hypothetical protein
MREKFGEKLEVNIHTLDSEEAKHYAPAFKGSTNVFLDTEWVPLRVAIDKSRMEALLSDKM